METQPVVPFARFGAGDGASVPGAAATPTHLWPAEPQEAPGRLLRQRRVGKPAAQRGKPRLAQGPPTPILPDAGRRWSPGERARLPPGLAPQPAALCGSVTRNPTPSPGRVRGAASPYLRALARRQRCPGLHRTAESAPAAAAPRPPPLPPLSRRDPEWEELAGPGSGRVRALVPPRPFPPLHKLRTCEGRDLRALGGALLPARSPFASAGARPWLGGGVLMPERGGQYNVGGA